LKLVQISLLLLVYDGSGNLEEGETAEARFIEIQAAYELLMDKEQRKQYDKDNRVNPMKVGIFFFLLQNRSLKI
jgi:curved DNA-binding protein CbpA